MNTKEYSPPKVTVLMSVYNGDKFLFEAIDSILHQTFTDFEFLIINDGSTDKTEEIILSFNDTRIVYHKNMSNEGLINCLNFGLLIAKGDYIARMDADDIAYPQRFEKQFLFMESNPEVGLLGSWVETIEEQQNRLIKFDSGDEVIRFKLFLTNYLHHPTVLIRNSILKKHNLLYPNFLHAEDYALWLKLIKHCKVEILSEPLLKYRVHDANISILNSEFQKRQTSKLRENEIDKLGLEWNDQQSKTFNMFIDQKKVLDFKTLINCCDVLSKIWQNKFNSSICFEFFKYELTYFIESNLTKVSNSDIQIFSKSKFSHSPKQIFRYHLKKTFGG